MEQAAEILVIILSIALAVFLILHIILAVLLIKVTRTVKRTAEKAEGLIGNVEAAAQTLRNVAGPMAFGKFFANMADSVFSRSKKGR